MKPENKTYVRLLMDSLKRKEVLLKKVLEHTKEQSELLKNETLDYDMFEMVMNQKAKIISELDEMDQGFNVIFKRVEKVMEQEKETCKKEILTMQRLITSLTDCSVSIQALEKKNSTAFQLYLSNEKNKIREKRTSSEVVSSYYKSMTGQNVQLSSHFIDKSK